MELTLFSTCKPFDGHIGLIQENAFRNWSGLQQTRVIIFGNEKGVQEASARWGFTHVDDVELGPQGYPLIPAMFKAVQDSYPEGVCLYTNSDMLYSGIEDALSRLVEKFPEFLMVGLRWDVSVMEELTFEEGWVEALREDAKYHASCGIDYFGFTSGLWPHIPRFQIGNVGFDNWLIDRALKSGKPVVDATEVVDAFHQWHPPRPSQKRPGDLHNLQFMEKNRRGTRGWVAHSTWSLTKEVV